MMEQPWYTDCGPEVEPASATASTDDEAAMTRWEARGGRSWPATTRSPG